MKHILQCQQCKRFTMHKDCPCGGEAISTKPARYSPGKFAKYRKEGRRAELEEQGLL